MNKEQMRIAIAEACGWTKCRLTIRGAGAPERRPSPHGFPPDKNYEAPLPEYLSCLNAMHEAEKHLPEDKFTYIANLASVVAMEEGFNPICLSTAEQRAEAFLKTIDKWVEG